jgi:uncharacterized membrane protein
MVGLDMLWLGVIAKPIYQQGIGHLMADKPNVPVAVLFYALFGLGLVVFAVLPAGPAPGWGKTLGMAALFGFFAYATYDLTNLATLKQWPISLSVIDMAWGTCISAAAAAGGKALMDWAAPLYQRFGGSNNFQSLNLHRQSYFCCSFGLSPASSRLITIENIRHNPAAAIPVTIASPLKLAGWEIPSTIAVANPVNAAVTYWLCSHFFCS